MGGDIHQAVGTCWCGIDHATAHYDRGYGDGYRAGLAAMSREAYRVTTALEPLQTVNRALSIVACTECDATIYGTGTLTHSGNGMHMWNPDVPNLTVQQFRAISDAVGRMARAVTRKGAP